MKKFIMIFAAGALVFASCTCSNGKKEVVVEPAVDSVALARADSIAKAQAYADSLAQAQREAEEAEAAAQAARAAARRRAAAKAAPAPSPEELAAAAAVAAADTAAMKAQFCADSLAALAAEKAAKAAEDAQAAKAACEAASKAASAADAQAAASSAREAAVDAAAQAADAQALADQAAEVAKLAAEKAAFVAESDASDEVKKEACEAAAAAAAKAAEAQASADAAKASAAEAAAAADAAQAAADALAAKEEEEAQIAAAVAAAAAARQAATKPFFLSLDGALNYAAAEGTVPVRIPTAEIIRAIGIQGGFTIGSEFTPVWGWRASVSGVITNGNSYRLVNREPRLWKNSSNKNYFPFASVELFGDVTLDLIDAFKPENEHLWNFYAFLGVGYLRTVRFSNAATACAANTNNNNLGVRAGLNLNRKITDNFAIGLEGSIMGMADQYNGIVGGVPFDMRATLGLSLIWTLGK